MKNNNRKNSFKSLSYQSGFVYNWFTKRLYDQKKKFLTISKLIGKDKKVLDIPCGTGMLARYLDRSIIYHGIDLNRNFLRKIKRDWKKGKMKPKKIILEQNNILDFKIYPKEKQDVIVLCDILHHIDGKYKELIYNAKRKARMVILCEPTVVKPKDNMNGHDALAKSIIKISKYFPEGLIKILDFFLGDNDGINSYQIRSNWCHSDQSIRSFYSKLGIKKIYSIMDEYIGIWYEN